LSAIGEAGEQPSVHGGHHLTDLTRIEAAEIAAADDDVAPLVALELDIQQAVEDPSQSHFPFHGIDVR